VSGDRQFAIADRIAVIDVGRIVSEGTSSEMKARWQNEKSAIDEIKGAKAELDEAQREGFSRSLRKRLGRDVRLHCDTDATLLGGAVIRAGDLVRLLIGPVLDATDLVPLPNGGERNNGHEERYRVPSVWLQLQPSTLRRHEPLLQCQPLPLMRSQR
jgi:hypothetical protein